MYLEATLLKLRGRTFPSVVTLAMVMSVPSHSMAQWDDVTEFYPLAATTQASYLGTAFSVADFNSDGLDDITAANSDGTVVAYVQLPSGGFEEEFVLDGTAQAQGIVWFDVDGDDDLDLMVTRRFAPIELYIRDGQELEESAASSGIPMNDTWESRGIAVADYDADGDLDAYISMYHDGSTGLSENLLLNNDGQGFFTDVTATAGVGNGLKHSFQSSWFDFDDDGDLDLWVINDRNSFPNAMYANNGDGTFLDLSIEVGLNQGILAMTATVGDPDNDGDYELFCSNVEDAANIYLDKNQGGIYVEVGADFGLDGMQYSWGGCWVDVEGDMDADLMVATYRFPNSLPYKNYYYENHFGGVIFTDETDTYWPNNQTQLYFLGVCDFNQDLAPDLIGLGNSPFLQLLQNATPEVAAPNERLVVQLCGTFSNRWAVGAEVWVHAGGVSQLQLVSAGTDYVTQQSWRRYFGLGTAQVVDSVEVDWPSGLHEVWYDIPAGTDLRLIEGTTTAALTSTGAGCAGESSWLNIPLPCPDVQVNGLPVLSDSLFMEGEGTYVVDCVWMGGLFEWSDTLVWAEQAPHAMTIQWTEPDCFNEPGSLGWNTDSTLTVELSGLSFSHSISNLQVLAGPLMLTTVDSSGVCAEMHEFELTQPVELELYIEYEPALCFEDSAQAFAAGYGGTPNYILNWGDVNPLMLPEGEVVLHLEDANGCTVDSTIVIDIPEPLTCEVLVTPEDVGNDGALELVLGGGTPPYDVLWNTGSESDSVLFGLSEGVYSWVLLDDNGCLLFGVQDLINVGVVEPDDQTGQLRRGPSGLWLKPGSTWSQTVQADFFDVQGRMVHSAVIQGEHMQRWGWDVLPSQGLVWVHDTEGRTYFRSAY